MTGMTGMTGYFLYSYDRVESKMEVDYNPLPFQNIPRTIFLYIPCHTCHFYIKENI